MGNDLSTFSKRLLAVTIGTGVITTILYFLLPPNWISPSVPYLFVFFFACTMISFVILNRALKNRFGRFVSVFMLTTAGKLFLFIGVMIVYSLLNKHDAVPFLLDFFILYLIFTVFEVIQVLGLTKSSTSDK